MDLLAAALLAGACAGLTALALRRLRARREQQRGAGTPADGATAGGGPARDQLEGLHLHDIVLYEDQELVVTGLARCQEREARWLEARLVDGAVELWLIVRPHDPDAALVGRRIPELGLGEEPSGSVEQEGKVYQLERSGQALLKVEGELDEELGSGEHRYWDYRRAGPDRLWIRRGPAGVATFAGQRVGRHLVCLLPGS